jgi:hypothetical protein
MAEDHDWGDIDQVPAKKPSSKLLFCGLGCLIPLVLLVAAGGWLYVEIRNGGNPELQWQRLDELLPSDPHPEGWEMKFGVQLGFLDFQLFVLTRETEEEGTMAITILQQGDPVDGQFDSASDDVNPWIPWGAEEPVLSIEVQGRRLRVARQEGHEQGNPFPWGTTDDAGAPGDGSPALAIELSPADAELPIVLYWMDTDLDSLTLEEVEDFLAYFQLDQLDP